VTILDDIDFLAFSLVFAPSAEVESAVLLHLNKWWKGGVNKVAPTTNMKPFSLEKKHNPSLKKVAIFGIDSDRPVSLIESNINDGYSSLTHMVSSTLPESKCIQILSAPVGRNEWPIEEFGLLQNRRYLRFVRTMLDTGGWEYWEEGQLQPFEEPEIYKKRNKKDRVTRELIVRYLSKLGINLAQIASGEGVQLSAFYTEHTTIDASDSKRSPD